MALDVDDSAWLLSRLTATEERIIACEAAISVVMGGAQSYTLDTGQTRQTVTRATLADLRNMLSDLENRRAVLRSQLGCGSVNVVPGF